MNLLFCFRQSPKKIDDSVDGNFEELPLTLRFTLAGDIDSFFEKEQTKTNKIIEETTRDFDAFDPWGKYFFTFHMYHALCKLLELVSRFPCSCQIETV